MEAVLSRANAVQYRVVHAPSVAVRSKPWGRKVGLKLCGTLVKSDMRTVGGQADGWVRLADERFGEEEGWMLIHGAKLGVGLLLQPVANHAGERGEHRQPLRRYRVRYAPHVLVRDRPRGLVVGKCAVGRVVRTDLELNGWVRLEADFYRKGESNPCEGWVLVNGTALGCGSLLEPYEAMLPRVGEALEDEPEGGSKPARAPSTRYWVTGASHVLVRDRPWGRPVGRKAFGALLRCDTVRDGWVKLEEDFLEENVKVRYPFPFLPTPFGYKKRHTSRAGECSGRC
mgnify:CR=1 FL=1